MKIQLMQISQDFLSLKDVRVDSRDIRDERS